MNGILLVTGGEAPGSPIPGSTRDSVQKFTVPRSSIILSILFGNRLPSLLPHSYPFRPTSGSRYTVTHLGRRLSATQVYGVQSPAPDKCCASAVLELKRFETKTHSHANTVIQNNIQNLLQHSSFTR